MEKFTKNEKLQLIKEFDNGRNSEKLTMYGLDIGVSNFNKIDPLKDVVRLHSSIVPVDANGEPFESGVARNADAKYQIAPTIQDFVEAGIIDIVKLQNFYCDRMVEIENPVIEEVANDNIATGL